MLATLMVGVSTGASRVFEKDDEVCSSYTRCAFLSTAEVSGPWRWRSSVACSGCWLRDPSSSGMFSGASRPFFLELWLVVQGPELWVQIPASHCVLLTLACPGPMNYGSKAPRPCQKHGA